MNFLYAVLNTFSLQVSCRNWFSFCWTSNAWDGLRA